MAYTITDTCTKDELCVEACPTDCIQPKKDETPRPSGWPSPADAAKECQRPGRLRRRDRRYRGECPEGVRNGHPAFAGTCRAVKVIEQNSKKRTVAFTNGSQTASLHANPLGDKLTQLVVASTLDPSQPSATSLVVKSIQNVCMD
jgi:hypothetical protein